MLITPTIPTVPRSALRDLVAIDVRTADRKVSAFDRLRLASANDLDVKSVPLRMAMVGSFAPRRCGIATFTSDVRDAVLAASPGSSVDIWPVRTSEEALDHEHALIEGDRESFANGAREINRSGVDLVVLQHEFGLFGGSAGDTVVHFVKALACPLIVTLHTVLTDPDQDQRRVMSILIERSARLVVMTERSRQILIDVYRADPERIALIQHGVPDRPFGRNAIFKERLGFVGPLLLTFGLLSPGKGVETVIKALPDIVRNHPDATYCIAGATHPNLLAREGESYREGLIELAHSLGVADKIRWVNRFLDLPELLDLIEAADIYLTPYPGAAQSTSGTLSYAVALGKAVISTPYVHANELLADGHGVIVPFGSPDVIAAEANALLDDPARMAALQHRAYARGRSMTWECYGEKLLALGEAVRVVPEHGLDPVGMLPLEGVVRLTDDCGILQHGTGGIPDRNHGYCIDDNARALLLMNRLGTGGGRSVARMASTYAAFMAHAWNDNRKAFRNFMSYSRQWLEDEGSEDSNGRALWVLGATIEEAQDARLRAWAVSLHDRAMVMAKDFTSPRAVAFAMIGAAHRLAVQPDHAESVETLRRGGAFLHALLDTARRPDWAWFEAMLAYDNARLPEAMIRAGRLLDMPRLVEEGLETLRWIVDQQSSPDRAFRPIGSDSFGREYAPPMPFDQQPLEAWATIEACAVAHEVSGSREWVEIARSAYDWYCGGNDRGLAVGDPESGSCFDGLTPMGVNANSGAESVLAYQLATVSMNCLLGRFAAP